MQALDAIRTLEVLCKATNKWGMYISFCTLDASDESYFDDIVKAAPYLNFDDHTQIFVEGSAYLLFDSKEEMEEHYWCTVGDDGPTPDFIKERLNIGGNDYEGPCRVYALTCDPTGQTMNENT